MSETAPLARKNYWSLDVAKFLCALMVISAHFVSEWGKGKLPAIVDYAFSIYVIAVPFFFCCSGFLFFKKLMALPTKDEKRRYFIQYEKRIWIMYGLWSVIYVAYLVYSWIVEGEFTIAKVLGWLHMALVFQTYSTIWFLPALAVGVAVTYFLVMHLSTRKIFVLGVLLYIFGMLGYTYNFLLADTPLNVVYDIYGKLFQTTRNGLFNGFPFIFMGYLVSQKPIAPSRKGFWRYAAPAIGFLVLLAAESFLLKLKFAVTGMDVGVFIVPFTYCFIMTVLQLELPESKCWLWCRRLSLLIFVAQRLFLTVLPGVFPVIFKPLYANPYIGLAVVIGLTVLFSVGLYYASKKITFLKYMM